MSNEKQDNPAIGIVLSKGKVQLANAKRFLVTIEVETTGCENETDVREYLEWQMGQQIIEEREDLVALYTTKVDKIVYLGPAGFSEVS